jgi:DNA-binding transcriptional MerR regulator/methylmalonyl-CoA mutase cobalamin-binding subunit
MSDSHNAIKSVTQRTGLNAHIIRIWEKRYGAVTPDRTATNRRIYSDGDIERLTLLRQLTQSGHSIGLVAKLPTERLRELATTASPLSSPTANPTEVASTAAALLADCLEAVRALDARGMEGALKRAETALGALGMLQRVASPLAQALGAQWREGSMTAAHEHFATAVLRTHLALAAKSFAAGPDNPVLLVATPAGQLHELGALLFSTLAASLGWQVTYLGASLPAAEIAGAARQQRVRAVALSLVYPEDDPSLEGELTRLRELLPSGVRIIVGGRAMPSYRDACQKIGALKTQDLEHAGLLLDELRRGSAKLDFGW